MNDSRFTFRRLALMGYYNLAPADQEDVVAAMTRLADCPVTQWPKAGAVKLKTKEPLYMVLVNDSLRALVQPVPGGPLEVVDLLHKDALAQFAGKVP
jgi:hypothetical protein